MASAPPARACSRRALGQGGVGREDGGRGWALRLGWGLECGVRGWVVLGSGGVLVGLRLSLGVWWVFGNGYAMGGELKRVPSNTR